MSSRVHPKNVASLKLSQIERLRIELENGMLHFATWAFRGVNQFTKFKEKRFKESLTEQFEMENSSQNLHYWAKNGDLEGLKLLFDSWAKDEMKKEEAIHLLDAAGCNVVQNAYLFKNYRIGRWLVERFPDMALEPFPFRLRDNIEIGFYQEEFMPYCGANILHLAIFRNDSVEVRWLLDFFMDHSHAMPHAIAKILSANATGRFFESDRGYYFGNYPLQFAVSVGNIQIFDMVLAFSATVDSLDPEEADPSETDDSLVSGSNVLFLRDSHGNTVLHLCVLHCLEEMFQHVYVAARRVIERELRLLFARHSSRDDYTAGKVCQLTAYDTPHSHGHVMHSDVVVLPETSNFESWLTHETECILNERLVFALNDEFHSPLTLAAAQIGSSKLKDPAKLKELEEKQVSMLRFLLRTLTQRSSFGGNLLNLNGVEVRHDLRCYHSIDASKISPSRVNNAVEWLCINDAQAAVMIPEIQQLIEMKWDRCGYPKFLIRFLLNCLITLLITAIAIFTNSTPTVKPSVGTEWTVTVFYPVVMFLFIVPFLMECREVVKFNIRYFSVRGAALFDIQCRFVKLLSFLSLCVLKWLKSNEAADDTSASATNARQQNYVGIKLSLTVCVICCWMHLYFFLMGFNSTGPFIVTIFRIVSRDVPYFLQFYMVVVIAFACALSVLTISGDFHALSAIWHVLQGIWTLVQTTVNVAPFHDVTNVSLAPSNLQWLSDILTTVYYIVVVLIMLNLLIGMISNTYDSYSEFSEAILLMEKYNIMCAMERSMSDAETEYYRDQFLIVQRRKDRFCGLEMGVLSNVTCRPNVKEGLLDGLLTDKVLKKFYQGRDYFLEVDKLALQSLEKVNFGGGEEEVEETTTLLIIDPQIDYHEELREEGHLSHQRGSLAIAGANEASARIATMILENKHSIHQIIVTVEGRRPTHISHALFWVDCNGNHPEMFTVICHSDIGNHRWVPFDNDPALLKWVLVYTKALEKSGLRLTIWPEHCVIGSTGQALVPVIYRALQEWEAASSRPVTYIMKGQNPRAEMYSALRAEVEDPQDPSTSLNHELLSKLKFTDRLLVCGEPMSHGVRFTMRDLMNHWHLDPSALMLLRDGELKVLLVDFYVDRWCQCLGV